MIVLKVIILLFSLVLHELAHGYMALFCGDKTAKYSGRLSLNPLKHLDPIGALVPHQRCLPYHHRSHQPSHGIRDIADRIHYSGNEFEFLPKNHH